MRYSGTLAQIEAIHKIIKANCDCIATKDMPPESALSILQLVVITRWLYAFDLRLCFDRRNSTGYIYLQQRNVSQFLNIHSDLLPIFNQLRPQDNGKQLPYIIQQHNGQQVTLPRQEPVHRRQST